MSTTLYFVRGDIPPQVKSARIPVRADQLSGIPGFLFPAQHRDAIREALAWLSHEVKELITSEWGVRELARAETFPPLPEVRIDYAEQPSPAWQEYLEEVKRCCEDSNPSLPILIHYTSGAHHVYEHGCLHLCFGGCTNFPVKVWKYDRDIAYCSAHFWVGELGPEHAYCRELIPALLTEFLPRIAGDVPDAGAQEFVTGLLQQCDTTQKALRAEITQKGLLVEKIQQQLVHALRSLEEAEKRLSGAVDAVVHRQEHFRQQYASLARREYIRSVHVTACSVTAVTDRVLIELQERSGEAPTLYDIGAFRIDLFTDGRDGCVSITNLTRRGTSPLSAGSAFHHPHVESSGKPCLGTIKYSLPRLIARHEYAAACDLLINFLRTVVPTDTYGRLITKWPFFSATNGGSS